MQTVLIFVGLVFFYSVVIMAIIGHRRMRNGSPPPQPLSAPGVRSRLILPPQ